MDPEAQEDWLDAKLREDAPYLDDAGFTARVVQQLPVRRRQSQKLRAAIILGITFLASVIAYVLTGGGAFLADAAAFLVAMPTTTLWILAACCGMVATGLSLSAVLSKSNESRS